MENLIKSVLLIAALLSTTGAEEVIYVQVGETAILKPPAGSDLKNKYLRWELDGNGLELGWCNTFGASGFTQDESWKGRLSLSDYSLIIKDMQPANFRTISLKYTSGGLIATYKLLKFTVSVKPSSPLLPGDSVSLHCDADAPPGQKKPAIHWLNPQGKKMGDNLGSLTMTATSNVSGQWTCVVTNGKETKAKVSVIVVDLSPDPPRPQYTSKSSPLTIPCSFDAHVTWSHITAKEIQEVQWEFIPKTGSSSPEMLFNLSLEAPMTWKPAQNRGLRPVPDPKTRNLSLSKIRGREVDRGDYKCALKFKNDRTLTRTVQVEVLQIISSPGTELISGQQLNLTCSLGHTLPSDLRLKWFPPKQSSLSPSDPHPAHLIIPEVGTGDGGKWRCELWQSNTLLTSTEITLKIEPKLSMWMLVVICSVTAIVILLFILAFIFYQRRKKMRHLRRRLCQCKSPKPKGFYRT